MSGPIPEWLLTVSVVCTVFTVMFGLGLGIVPGHLRWAWQRPGLMARALFSVLIAIPALALVITRWFDLSRVAQIGIVLMAISPGAPVALRRSHGAGGHQAFAPTLQICVVMLAVVSMPLSIALLNHVYAGHASITPGHVARQVFIAQLLPLGLGIALRYARVLLANWLEPKVSRIGTVMLIVVAILIIINVWEATVNAGLRVAAAIVLITGAALAVGHLLGGPEPPTRTAVAIISAARNPGLALLVATLNKAPPAIQATVLAYLLISVFTIVPYVWWRRKSGPE
ncbi:MAG: bile acid:sodium symporter family protein [Gammaproteobacteria bacterium]